MNAIISSWSRSPFTLANKGTLARVRPDEMAAQVVKALIAKHPSIADEIEDVIVGCAFPEGEQGMNVARIIGFLAGIPQKAGAVTVNRFCGSSMQAIHMAAGAIATGSGEVFLCGGVESMTRIPMGGYNFLPHPGLMKTYPEAYTAMGITAENVAKKHGITREAQEAFALFSQQKAAKAITAGLLKDEITPISYKDATIETDGCPRPDTSTEGLAGLKPAFLETGTVTAGTASPLTDGAAFCIVASEEACDRLGLPKLARIKSMAVSGCAPEIMGLGPIGASRKALERANLKISDMDVVELNEAFAAQSLPCISELGLNPEKVNLDGGAIAIGHPLGATGARITAKAASLLGRTKGRYALATQCIGGGQGIATVLEAVK
ncbi:acetyl-CoA C-acyltransferase [bacterium]|nr:acetyl-CoA C-acyltransferase [bacterium]